MTYKYFLIFLLEPKACGHINSNKGLIQEQLKDDSSGTVRVYDGFKKRNLNDVGNFFLLNNFGYPWYITNDSLDEIYAYKGDYQIKIFIIHTLLQRLLGHLTYVIKRVSEKN